MRPKGQSEAAILRRTDNRIDKTSDETKGVVRRRNAKKDRQQNRKKRLMRPKGQSEDLYEEGQTIEQTKRLMRPNGQSEDVIRRMTDNRIDKTSDEPKGVVRRRNTKMDRQQNKQNEQTRRTVHELHYMKN